MIQILAGTNWEPLKAELDRLIADFVANHGDLAVEKIDLEEAELDQLLAAVESLPFLAEKKLVVASKLSAQKEASEILQKLIERAGEATDVIIVEGKLDKRGTYYKALKKLPNFKEFNELDQAGLERWSVAYVTEKGGSLSSRDSRYLVERIGTSQTLMARELDKLLAFDPKITRDSIDDLTEATPQTTIFNLVDQVFSGQAQKALDLYDEQRLQKVEPQAIIGMFAWQLHVLAVVAQAPSDMSDQAIAKRSGISPFVIGKSRRLVRAMSIHDVRRYLATLRKIDLDSKSKTIDLDDALKYFILSLAK